MSTTNELYRLEKRPANTSSPQPVALLGRSHSYTFRYAFHSFELFDLRLCGADLLGNYSSHWTAMIDTGAACLSLPLEFFNMVRAIVLVACILV